MSDDDWEYNHSSESRDSKGSSPSDMSNAIKKQVDVSDDGHLKIFGKEFDVGRNGALLLRPLVDLAISQMSVRGAATATRWGTNAFRFVMPKNWAAKAGRGLGFVWLFGLSASDVALGIKKTVNDSYTDMHELRDKWAPLLAANHNMDVSVGKALTTNCGVIAHARARVYQNSKRELLATMAGGIRAIPTILMGVYQHGLDNIMDPKRVHEAYKHNNMSQVERDDLAKKLQKLRAQRMTPEQELAFRNAKDQDLIGTISRLFSDPKALKRMRSPQNEYELRENIRSLTLMPPLFGLGGELIERQMTKKNNNQEEDAGDKILKLQAFIHNHDEPDREHVVIQVREIFQQRAKDIGRRYMLEGDTFNRTCDAIADAVLTGMHPQAIGEILDNRKVITFGTKEYDFGDAEDIKIALDALKQKFTKKITEKKFYKDAPFTKETLIKTFKDIPEEEKPFFVQLFPPGILEKAGVPKSDVKKYQEKGKQYFVDELLRVTKAMMHEEREELKKHDVKTKALCEFEAFKETYQNAESNGHGSALIEKDPEKASRVVRDVMLSAKSPKELWQEYLKKRGEENVAHIPKEERKGAAYLSDDKEKGPGLPAK